MDSDDNNVTEDNVTSILDEKNNGKICNIKIIGFPILYTTTRIQIKTIKNFMIRYILSIISSSIYYEYNYLRIYSYFISHVYDYVHQRHILSTNRGITSLFNIIDHNSGISTPMYDVDLYTNTKYKIECFIVENVFNMDGKKHIF